jgi:hypothetical protein
MVSHPRSRNSSVYPFDFYLKDWEMPWAVFNILICPAESRTLFLMSKSLDHSCCIDFSEYDSVWLNVFTLNIYICNCFQKLTHVHCKPVSQDWPFVQKLISRQHKLTPYCSSTPILNTFQYGNYWNKYKENIIRSFLIPVYWLTN